MHFEPVGHEGKHDVLGTQSEDAKQSDVCTKDLVVPTVLSSEIEVHGRTFSGDEKNLQKKTGAFKRKLSEFDKTIKSYPEL